MNRLGIQDLKIGHLIFQSLCGQDDWGNSIAQSYHSQNISHVRIIIDNHGWLRPSVRTGKLQIADRMEEVEDLARNMTDG